MADVPYGNADAFGGRVKLTRTSPTSWQLADAGGIDYVHAADGRHYRPWRRVNGARVELEPVEQLAMAARAVDGR